MKYFVVVLLAVTTVAALALKKEKEIPPPPPPPRQEFPQKKEPQPQPEPEVEVEPDWTSWPKLRDADPKLGKTLQDIESHMPKGHHYAFPNKITWAHETTHGISSNIRNHFHQTDKKINAFYCLQDRGCVVEEPPTTLEKVAQNIPPSLRGEAYQLYLVRQRRDWNDWPLYLCDEWNAYTNGAVCGKELNHDGKEYEALLATEFNFYCLAAALTAQENCPYYDHTQLKKFLIWNTKRVNALNEERTFPHREKFKNSPDAKKLRDFAKSYLGEKECKKLYDF